jgi:5'-nucleotidase
MAKKSDKEPIILVTNDDGITAPGIKALIEVAKQFGRVIVVAPDSPQSGMGHAITIGKPLRLHEVDIYEGVEAYQCSGTPVDCVKLATDVILKGTHPSLCVSGINHGSNASINVIYSGTMSAAMEASIEKIPSVGFSLLNYNFDADFTTAQFVAAQVIEKILSQKNTEPKLYNVNIPYVPIKKLKGIKLCRQANAKWKENFVARKDPMGKNYYWLTGEFLNPDKGKDTDIYALENNYASIVPVQYDLTDYKTYESESELWNTKLQKSNEK